MTAGRLLWLRGWQHRVIAAALFSLLSAATSVSAQNVFPSTGNAGVGTTTPAASLHIRGSGTSGQVTGTILLENGLSGTAGVDITGLASSPRLRFLYGDGPGTGTNSLHEAMALMLGGASAGYIGIGTPNPQSKLHLATGPNVATLTVEGTGARLRLFDNETVGRSWSLETGILGAWLAIRDLDAGVDRLVVAYSTGNVGIGTSAPQSKLHVAGDAQVDGNIGAKYQDVAEWVKARESLPPGTVVVLDDRDSNAVVASDRPYDARVAGVVSRRPGILLGEPSENAARIAHSGRVKVKVDASYGSIAVGDLLVTSSRPGYAMRSQPMSVGGVAIHQPGTLLGKALEQLKEGEGEILVLLTLQ